MNHLRSFLQLLHKDKFQFFFEGIAVVGLSAASVGSCLAKDPNTYGQLILTEENLYCAGLII